MTKEKYLELLDEYYGYQNEGGVSHDKEKLVEWALYNVPDLLRSVARFIDKEEAK